MVSEKKRQTLKEVSSDIEKSRVVGVINMHNLPARQLFQIKEQLKEKARIRMVKKRVIKLALDQSKKHDIKKLLDNIQNQPALLFSDANPFELAVTISKSASKALAKPGDIAPMDIIIPEGPTNLPPGPAIGELQKIKIPAGVEGDKIVVKKETCVVKEGEEISQDVADVLMKLNIEPMEITLNLVAIWDEGIVFGKDLLFIPLEQYVGELQSAYTQAFNLALNIDYLTKDTVPVLLSKAHQQAISLAMDADIITSETVDMLLAKANSQAKALQGMVKDDSPAPKPEENTEGTKEEEKPKDEPEKKDGEADNKEEKKTKEYEPAEEKEGGKEESADEKKEEGGKEGEKKD